MPTSLYDLSVGSYLQVVGATAAFLEKGAAHCAENGIALEDVEHRLIGTEQRLDDALERLSENEERLDFAERLLTRMKSQDQLKPGN